MVPATSRSTGAGARPGHSVVSAACGLATGASIRILFPGSAPGPPSRTRRASGEHPPSRALPVRSNPTVRITDATAESRVTGEPLR
jgi:hypothetical protein